jgi:hypothetical protein
MLELLRNLLRSRYVGLLEGEVCRLRAENRALTNSLLGTAGFPPLEFPEPPKPQPVPRSRRRSWHQIQAWRENEARLGKQWHCEDEWTCTPQLKLGPVRRAQSRRRTAML